MMKVVEMPVQTFIDLCQANAEIATALLKATTELDERKGAKLDADREIEFQQEASRLRVLCIERQRTIREHEDVMQAMDRRNKGMLQQLDEIRKDADAEISAYKDRWALLRDRLQLLRDRMSQNAGNVADCINYLDAFVAEVANDTTD
jgi:small-conductance mechanosensitive channel